MGSGDACDQRRASNVRRTSFTLPRTCRRTGVGFVPHAGDPLPPRAPVVAGSRRAVRRDSVWRLWLVGQKIREAGPFEQLLDWLAGKYVESRALPLKGERAMDQAAKAGRIHELDLAEIRLHLVWPLNADPVEGFDQLRRRRHVQLALAADNRHIPGVAAADLNVDPQAH